MDLLQGAEESRYWCQKRSEIQREQGSQYNERITLKETANL